MWAGLTAAFRRFSLLQKSHSQLDLPQEKNCPSALALARDSPCPTPALQTPEALCWPHPCISAPGPDCLLAQLLTVVICDVSKVFEVHKWTCCPEIGSFTQNTSSCRERFVLLVVKVIMFFYNVSLSSPWSLSCRYFCLLASKPDRLLVHLYK